MTANTQDRVAITLTHPNISDQAWDMSLADGIDTNHDAFLSAQTLTSLHAAQTALDANPAWNEITVRSDLSCASLQHGLDETEDWATGSEAFHLHRYAGLSLRITHKHDADAWMEFEVHAADGDALITPEKHPR